VSKLESIPPLPWNLRLKKLDTAAAAAVAEAAVAEAAVAVAAEAAEIMPGTSARLVGLSFSPANTWWHCVFKHKPAHLNATSEIVEPSLKQHQVQTDTSVASTKVQLFQSPPSTSVQGCSVASDWSNCL
jgi:hypothetical protein